MYHPATVTCDVCEKQHGETNGWYTVRVLEGSLENERSIQILPLSEKDIKDFPAICGENCLSKFISQRAPNLQERV